MSRRTAEANKAIASAWEREQCLVKEGKGTRDWTPQQQKDILEKGKAYDLDGKAMEGHHMKSVSIFPNYQGNPDNIQFLSRAEHFDAHGGNYQTPTNGYYNTIEKVTIVFENELTPCDIIVLSDPVVESNINHIISNNTKLKKGNFENSSDSVNEEKTFHNHIYSNNRSPRTSGTNGLTKKAIFRDLYRAKETFHKIEAKHPVAVGVVKTVGPIVVKYVLSYGTSKALDSINSSLKNNSKNNTVRTISSTTKIKSKGSGTISPSVSDAVKRGTHASPVKHSVSGYTKHMNGKEINVAPYVRGGKSVK